MNDKKKKNNAKKNTYENHRNVQVCKGDRDIVRSHFIIARKIGLDVDISLEAKGFLLLVLSYPETIELNIQTICSDGKISKEEYLSICDELKKNGYLTQSDINPNCFTMTKKSS